MRVHFESILRINTSQEVRKGTEEKNRSLASSLVLVALVSGHPFHDPGNEIGVDSNDEFTSQFLHN